MGRDADRLARGEWAVLALLAEHPAHGWALSNELAPSSEIGQIWSGDRQRVYRALRRLTELKLIEASLVEPGRGAHRTVFRITPGGSKRLQQWLGEPVQQMREASSTFLLKLVFTQRAGRDATSLVSAQRGTVVAAIEALSQREHRAGGAAKLDVRLRLETARALLNFIDSLSIAKAARTQPRRRAAERRGVASSDGSVSDFTGIALDADGDRATIIVRFDDPRRGILVAAAHVADPIVEEIDQVARQAVPEGVSGSG